VKRSKARGFGGRGNRVDWQCSANYNVPFALAAASQSILILAGFQPVAQPTPGGTARPVIGQETVEADIDFWEYCNAQTNGNYYFHWGVYQAEWDSQTGVWPVLNPLSPSDANRKEWIHLEHHVRRMDLIASAVNQTGSLYGAYHHKLKVPSRTLGVGEALILARFNSALSVDQIGFIDFTRLKVSNEF